MVSTIWVLVHPEIIYDVVTLTTSSTGIVELGSSCMGTYAGYAKKVIVSSSFTDALDSAFLEDLTVKEIVFEGDTFLNNGCCYGCTNLEKIVLYDDTVIEGNDLLECLE